MQGAAKSQAAVLGVKWKGVHLQATCRDHLHGLVILDHAGGVDVNIWEIGGPADVHATPEWGGETEECKQKTWFYTGEGKRI